MNKKVLVIMILSFLIAPQSYGSWYCGGHYHNHKAKQQNERSLYEAIYGGSRRDDAEKQALDSAKPHKSSHSNKPKQHGVSAGEKAYLRNLRDGMHR